MQNKMTFILILVLLLAMPQVGAQSQTGTKQKVAVFVDGPNAGEGVADFLGSKMVIAITDNGKYTAVERTKEFLSQIYKSAGYDRGAEVDASTIAGVGKQYGADIVCAVVVKTVLNEKYVSARLINVETAEVLSAADGSKNYSTVSDLSDLAQEVTQKLFGNAKVGRTTTRSSFPVCEQCADNMQDLEVFRDAGAMTWQEAKQYCSGLGSGWYLPSKQELNQLYVNKAGIGGFSDESYWSSTEYNSNIAWEQAFGYGRQGNDYKSYTHRVRCVRRVN